MSDMRWRPWLCLCSVLQYCGSCCFADSWIFTVVAFCSFHSMSAMALLYRNNPQRCVYTWSPCSRHSWALMGRQWDYWGLDAPPQSSHHRSRGRNALLQSIDGTGANKTTRAGLRYCGALSTWQSGCPLEGNVWGGAPRHSPSPVWGSGLGLCPPRKFFQKSTLKSLIFRHFLKLKWSLLQWRQGQGRIKMKIYN